MDFEDFFGIIAIAIIVALVGGGVWGFYQDSRNEDEILKPFAVNMTQLTTEFELPPHGFDLLCMGDHSVISLRAKLTTAKNALIPVVIPLEDTCDASEPNQHILSVRYGGNGLPKVAEKMNLRLLTSHAHMLDKVKFANTFKKGFAASIQKAQAQYNANSFTRITTAMPKKVSTTSATTAPAPIVAAKPSANDMVNMNVSAN